MTYGIQLWGTAKKSNMYKKFSIFLRLITKLTSASTLTTKSQPFIH